MKQLLLALLVVSAIELLLAWPLLWRGRRWLGSLVGISLLGISTTLFVVHPRVWTLLIAVFSYYRCFNLLRVLKGRMHEAYLKNVALTSSRLLIICQLLTLGLFLLVVAVDDKPMPRWAVISGLQLLLVVVLLMSTLRHLRTTREPLLTTSYPDRELPTLSVAIPARNETDDLEACLQSLVANDYPKLEILVLDDCSSNARTPEIIRSYAHAGVRFISGDEPQESWLAKNWAYRRLREEASGDVMLFCGVDTRFSPVALRRLVGTMLEKQKSMVSVLPHNSQTGLRSLLIQPMRYAWELCLPRRLFQRPPVLSTCWLIKTDVLKSAGGFKAVSRSIVPESHFARTAAVHDGYSFVRSNDVVSTKPYNEQRATAIRTRYPQLHRRPEWVALVSLLELTGLVGPYILFIASLLNGWWLPAILSGLASLGLIVTVALVLQITYQRYILLGIIAVPLLGLLDVLLLHESMIQYEFSDVIWKGRNVCIPVMHVVPTLSKLH